jgi:hypothetical protein
MSAPETGESSARINRRSDDAAWPSLLLELEAGATLLHIPKLKRAYADKGQGPYGAGVTATYVRKLEREGVIKFVGVDRYALRKPAS